LYPELPAFGAASDLKCPNVAAVGSEFAMPLKVQELTQTPQARKNGGTDTFRMHFGASISARVLTADFISINIETS